MLRKLNPEMVLGALISTILWSGVLGWQSSYAPAEKQKQECHEAAKRHGSKTEECKSFWEKTTSDPVAFFAFGTFIFTGVLGISTIGLWFANQRTAKIAERALTELESPFVGLKIVENGLITEKLGADDWIITVEDPLKYCFVNYGRTPAILMRLRDKLQICESGQLPTLEWQPERDKPYPYGVLIGSGKESIRSTRDLRDYADNNESLIFTHGDSDLFLVGRLTYRDIFNCVYEMGFCAVFNRDTSRFLMRGGKRYNYCRRDYS